MSSWKYDLGSVGSELKKTIHSAEENVQDCIKILNQLVVCFESIKQMVSEKEYFWYFAGNEEFIRGVLVEFENSASAPDDYEDAQAIVNDALDEFYDSCDSLRIWIGV